MSAGATGTQRRPDTARQAVAHLPGRRLVLCVNEVRRTGEPWNGPYKELRPRVRQWRGSPWLGPRHAVVERFGAGVRDHLAIAGPRPLVVGTHGMAMTVWLTATVELPAPADFWESLAFPDARGVPLAELSGSS